MTENPRFPHTIKITRTAEAVDEFTPAGDPVIIYQGEGRCYKNTKSRYSDGVILSDLVLAIPTTSIKFAINDDIEATTPSNGDVIRGKVVDRPIVNNFGTNLYFNNTGR